MRGAPGQAALMADSMDQGGVAASSGSPVMSGSRPHTSHSTLYLRGERSIERRSPG